MLKEAQFGEKTSVQVSEIQNGKASVCEGLLRALPDWFGIEEAILNYANAVKNLPTLIAKIDGELVGFVSLEFHNQFTAEIHVMAVKKTYHRKGIGRALIETSVQFAKNKNAELLMVKTLGPSRPSVEYDQTRNFYLSTGFRPLEEFKTIWNESNPCLIMVRALR